MQYITKSLSTNQIVFHSIDTDLDTARRNAVITCEQHSVDPEDTVTVASPEPLDEPYLERVGVFWPEGSEPFISPLYGDAEFIEFAFADPETAALAEQAFPYNVVNMGSSLGLRAKQLTEHGREIRTKLNGMGIIWSEIAADLQDDDMWPEWPEDSDDTVPTP